MSSYPIRKIGGLDPEEVKALKSIGIRTTERLLEEAKNPKGRSVLAEKTGFEALRILSWANAADRMRIKGMGEGYSCLLQAVGVDTIRELRYRNPANLAKAMGEANKKRKLVRFLPSEKMIVSWVKQAKELTPKITYR
jgi:predicted RecB family nuclease